MINVGTGLVPVRSMVILSEAPPLAGNVQRLDRKVVLRLIGGGSARHPTRMMR